MLSLPTQYYFMWLRFAGCIVIWLRELGSDPVTAFPRLAMAAKTCPMFSSLTSLGDTTSSFTTHTAADSWGGRHLGATLLRSDISV